MPDLYAPIGIMRTCFKEKFGVPRQSMLAPSARGVLKLGPDPRFKEAVRELETFSHIWILFKFDRQPGDEWRARIEPPRADGPRTVGVFASRSPRRPNPIGMSAVKLERIDLHAAGGVEIHVSGVDLLDGTPVLDVKPYLPYADSIPDASSGWASAELARYPVTFSPESEAALSTEERRLIGEMLALDPRPTPQRRSMPAEDKSNLGKVFRFRALGFDVEWRIEGSAFHVLRVITLE